MLSSAFIRSLGRSADGPWLTALERHQGGGGGSAWGRELVTRRGERTSRRRGSQCTRFPRGPIPSLQGRGRTRLVAGGSCAAKKKKEGALSALRARGIAIGGWRGGQGRLTVEGRTPNPPWGKIGQRSAERSSRIAPPSPSSTLCSDPHSLAQRPQQSPQRPLEPHAFRTSS